MVELLLKNGAQIDATAMNGSTPLYRAIESSRVNVVQYLMSCNARVTVENSKGVNPMEHSHQWADAEVNVRVQNKFDAMGPPKEDKSKEKGAKGKGKGSAKGKGDGKGAAGGSAAPLEPIVQPPGPRASSPSDEQLHSRRKASILRAASALAGGLEEREDIHVALKKPWQELPNTAALLKSRQFQRERYGWGERLSGRYSERRSRCNCTFLITCNQLLCVCFVRNFKCPFNATFGEEFWPEGGPDED